MSETPLGSNRLTDSNPSRPNNQSPSFPKPLDLSRDNSQPEYLPTTSQLLLVPTKSNPDAARFSPHNNSIVHSSFSQEATRDLIRPRPLDRRTSGYSSRRSEGPGEGDFGHVSGISMRHERKRREKRNSIKSSISPANRSYLGTNHSRSIGIHDDTSQELNSYSYSGLHQIQQYYHDNENRSMISNVDSAAKRQKKQWKSKVKDTYYRLLRKRLGRRHSYIRKDPAEFDEQIEVINDNVRIPNEERVQDLKLVEKTRYETLQRYTDKYPLLNLRKKVMILASRISSICHTVVTSPIFDFFILLIIISNTILLALDDPTNDNDLLSYADNYFLGVYTAEMALKIFGLGFVWNHGSYLRDPWNILDFVIVITGYLPLVMTSNALNLRALRSLRVLRPLKTISTIHALRVIVVTLMAAMKPLLETIFILLFLFLIFAIAGLQLFSGSMKKRCFSLESGIPLADNNNNDSDFDEKLCISDGDCGTVDGNLYICGKMLQNPNYGVTNFDNIFSALLMAFQTVTTEGWSQTMEILQETFSPVAAIYFIVLIFLGSFFLLNLTLAIIKAEYTGNSRMNISVKRAQKATYDDRFMQKISDHKLDILKLIHKNKTGETLYDKYHFKNDQLIAVETSKHADRHSSPKKKKESVKKKKNIAPSGLMFLNSFWRLRGGMNYGGFRRVTGNSTVLPESKTDIPTMLDLGSENNLDMKKIKPGSFKIFPEKGSMTELVHKDTSDQAALALAVTAPSEKPSPLQAPMGLRPGQKFGSKQSSDSPADSPFAGNVQQHSPPNKFEDAVELQENNNQPHADQSNVQVYKQARGFGDLKIRITEAAQENNMVYNEDSEQVQSSVFPRMYPSQGLPSSVPSIIEEEEASELSPSRISEYTNGSRVAKKQLWSRGARPSHKEPVRPVMTEKVRMSSEEKVMKSGGIEMINIAGIRNKKQSRSQQPKKELRIESDPMLATSQELPDDEDMMDDDDFFLEFLKKQEEEKRTNSRETRTRAALIQKINQIKRLSDSQRRFFSGQGRSAMESDGHSQKGSRRLSSWLASEDFDVNYTRNSGSQFKSSMQKTGGILEDSDFMNRSKKSKNSPKRRNRLYPMKKKQAMGRKQGLLRGLTLKNNANFNIEEEKEQEDEGEVQVEKKQPEEEMEALMTEEDIIEIKEQEKHMIVNLKKLKTQPLRERNYASYSLDDVIPSKKIQEKLRQQEEEKRRIKENRLAQVYRVTTAERKAAKERELQRQKVMQDEGWNLAIKTGALGKILRKQKEEEKAFDDDINAALEKGRESQGEKTGSVKQGKIFSKGMNNTGGRLVNSISKVSNGTGKGQVKKKVEEMKIEEEEEFTEEQRKDIFAVLRKMQTPFANEKENEESDEYKKKMTGFAFEEEHRKIRVKDLEMDNVSTLNWSGHAVLSLTYNDVPADRIKQGLNNKDWDIWRPGVMGVIHELRRITRKIIALQAFNAIIILSVFMNTIILACDGLVEDEGTLNAFSSLNDAFTIIFAVEMGLKVFGLGVMTYAMDTINLFDAIVVILSIVEQVAVDGKNSAAGAFRVIRLFRTLRVLRVTKLLRALSYMQVIIGVIIRSAKKFVYVLLLLMLMIIIYALLGMQLYGGKLYVDANNIENLHTRTNFDQFGTALLTVFQVMTQEDWNAVLFLMMRSSVNGIITCAYLISWMFLLRLLLHLLQFLQGLL